MTQAVYKSGTRSPRTITLCGSELRNYSRGSATNHLKTDTLSVLRSRRKIRRVGSIQWGVKFATLNIKKNFRYTEFWPKRKLSLPASIGQKIGNGFFLEIGNNYSQMFSISAITCMSIVLNYAKILIVPMVFNHSFSRLIFVVKYD